MPGQQRRVQLDGSPNIWAGTLRPSYLTILCCNLGAVGLDPDEASFRARRGKEVTIGVPLTGGLDVRGHDVKLLNRKLILGATQLA